MNALWQLSATELAALIRARTVSAREAAQAALDRLEAVNPVLNAVVDHRPAEVLARADAIDAALKAGIAPGPLAGVPVTVKVNVDQAGYATSNGLTSQRDLIATDNSPVVDNLLKAGAVIVGRTNTPAFSYRWFTSNQLYGETLNPRDPALTPGGSSGGAASSLAAGIGHIAHGTDIALALAAMSPRDVRDPWWVPAPLEGPSKPKRAALAVTPDGLDVADDVKAAVRDAAARLARAGWIIEEVATPPLAEAAEHQTKLWLADGYDAMVAAAEREGDPGAINVLRHHRAGATALDLAGFSKILSRRATLLRQWQIFFETYAVVLMPVSAELPFPNHLDMRDEASFARVWRAQMPQIGLPLLGLPALTVSTGLVGRAPVGVQIVSSRYREDLCLAAGEAIEAGGTPPAPIEPVKG
jgi:amidase